MFVFQVFLFDLCLAFGTFFPAVFRRFIAPDMNDFRGEQFHHFVQHIFKEAVGLFISGTQNIFLNSPLFQHFKRTSGTREMGIGRQCRQHMPRHIDLRNDGDVALPGIGDNIADLWLRIVPSVRQTVERLIGIFIIGLSTSSPGAYLR